ncbi:alcohol dehydrogenase [Diplocarpon rosae]|nr:alcohol dehydrogenase [Diplocarpon rosae]
MDLPQILLGFRFLRIGGHEGIGEVIERGPGVTSPAIGAKVGIKYAAESPDNCLVGGQTSCTSVKISGCYHPGTFQQYLVSSAQYATPIPDGLDLAGAAPLMCAGITVYAALKRSGTRPGDIVLVTGAGGGLGHLAIQYAKVLGAKVIAIDSGPKEALCRELGASTFIDYTHFQADEEITGEVKKSAPNGVKTVLCCVTSQRAYGQSIGFLGFRGTLVCLGVPDGMGASWPIPGATVGVFLDKELSIMGLKAGNQLEAKECLEVAATGAVRTRYELRPMDSVTQASHKTMPERDVG